MVSLANSLPYTSNGITICKVEVNRSKVTFVAKNDTGIAISGLSEFGFKCYAQDGTVLKACKQYLHEMNSGEMCKCSFYISLDTASIELGEGTPEPTTPCNVDKTALYGELVTNALPCILNDIWILRVSRDEQKRIQVAISNRGEKVIDNLSSIEYKCYDKDGIVIDSGKCYLTDLEPQEMAKIAVRTKEETSKIVFHNADIRTSVATQGVEVEKHRSLITNKLPCDLNGIRILDIYHMRSGVDIKIENNTGGAISGKSTISYKAYGLNGVVLRSDKLYLVDMNAGERAELKIGVEGISKIIFGEASIEKGRDHAQIPTRFSSGITTNILPYSMGGVSIIDVSVSKNASKLVFAYKNTSDFPISDLSSVEYKCYDAYDCITQTSSAYLNGINPKETGQSSFFLPLNTKKVVFTEARLQKGELFSYSGDLSRYKDIMINTLPYTTNGLTVRSVSNKLHVYMLTIENNTGNTVSGYSTISFKCYNSRGRVVSSKATYLEEMKNGESCVASILIPDDTTMLIIGTASIK